MLRTAFLGSDNLFDKYMCHWLRERSDLRLIIWVDELRWAAPPYRARKLLQHYRLRAQRFGRRRVADEIIYYIIYHAFLRERDADKLRSVIEHVAPEAEESWRIAEVPQIRPTSLNDPEVLQALQKEQVDALFAVCIDALVPEAVISEPRLGSYLWHEGITPEYRGRYPSFWALANDDLDRLGYTLLRMNMELDAGDVFVQGKLTHVDPARESHVVIAHKAILASLPECDPFLKELEQGTAVPLKPGTREGRAYTYPTASVFIKLLLRERVVKPLRRRRARMGGSP
ncbi:MAG: formyltransferase family protein [Solirubrobacteraceae bacterium]